MNILTYKGYKELAEDISSNLHKVADGGYDLVVGIPRSGMIPAYIISSYLNLDCIDLLGFLENRPLQHGLTRGTKFEVLKPSNAKNILFVDDSVYSGNSIKKIVSTLPEKKDYKYTTLAIYSSSINPNNIDIYFEQLDGIKLFEWGMHHSAINNKSCYDLDGVICEDLELRDDYSEEEYIDAIKNARLRLQPTFQIHSIVTNRPEKFRNYTEDWLKKHSIDYQLLKMLPNIDRTKIDPAIDHKAKTYRNLKETVLFIESNHIQAEKICLHSGKPSYSTDTKTFFSPSVPSKLIYNKIGLFTSLLNNLKHKIKTRIKY